MREYQQIDADGIVVGHLITEGEIDAPHMIETAIVGAKLGQRFTGSGFEPVPPSGADTARAELEAIDRRTGMSRLMRETLIVLAGANVPAKLAEEEAKAATARGKLAK